MESNAEWCERLDADRLPVLLNTIKAITVVVRGEVSDGDEEVSARLGQAANELVHVLANEAIRTLAPEASPIASMDLLRMLSERAAAYRVGALVPAVTRTAVAALRRAD